MTYENIQKTIYKLLNLREYLAFPQNWRQSDNPDENASTLSEAFHAVRVEHSAYQHNLDEDNTYPSDLNRGEIPEPVWFVRQAMNKVAPEFGGLIYKWNDAPGRTHEEVFDLVTSAIDLAKNELTQILASDDTFDMSDIVLHRWADRDGSQLCAMSALSQKLGYTDLTDMPKEVDPGLAALLNLLNDRANDGARQLLASRLKHVPYSGRTNITSLICRVFLPKLIKGYGYAEEVEFLAQCNSRSAFSHAYASLSERLIEPDGVGIVATACITLSEALKNADPVKQDLLAVSAASQLVGFELGWGWVDLLYILDFILGLEDRPYERNDQSYARYGEYFEEVDPDSEATGTFSQITPKEKKSTTIIYDLGIKVQWFPALVEKFPDRLEEIAQKIFDEVTEIGSTTIFSHRFSFEDEEVMIVTSWDDDLDMLFADADLVAYLDVVGEADIDGDGEAETVLMPIPASNAGYIH
jgi:hypothetical protein